VFDTSLPAVAKEVEPQTVFGRICLGDKGSTEGDPLSGIHKTLKDRVLHSLAAVLAEARYTPQSSLPGFIACAYVVTDQNQQCVLPP
jgi:hypothetical protein